MSDEETIFEQALRIETPRLRAEFLDRACADRPQLRQRLEALLLAHEQTSGILESPPIRPTASPSPLEQPGAVVGNYKLLEQIGEGGMGAVYMAEQVRPVKRRVALKIIKPGLDTKQVIARFVAERQALAMMDHPSIAKVFDAGTTETGRPYFVMELVRGVPITEYCDQHHLTPRQRLELFVQVCQAVQHAHQKGIIHRDLKPNNVLVTLSDGDKPTPKVIDFGIAKAAGEQRLTDRTLFTEFRQLIGTPLYMSPEQAEMSQLTDVDTRSDVYSLGVLLYELLTSTTPFDKHRLAQAAYDEVRRIIREEEPPRPSTRLSTLGQTLSSISAQRQTDPKKLSQTIRGELDWIVMKALEKDRARRYETANGLARDVERYLTDQPVEACPPSRRYKFRKFARRNKSTLVSAAVIFAILLIATALSSWEAVRANRAATALRIQRDRADRAAKTATRVADYLQRAYSTAAYTLGAKDQVVRGVLDELGQRLNEGLDDDPEVEAGLHLSLAKTYLYHFGDADKAEQHFARAVQLYRRTCGEHDETYADSLANHAWALSNSGKGTAGQAAAEAQQAVAIFRDRGIQDGRFTFAVRSLIKRLAEAQRTPEIKPLQNELLAILQRDPKRQLDADELSAEMAVGRHDLPSAEGFFRRAYDARAASPHGNWISVHFADVLAAERKFPETIKVRQTAVVGFRHELPADHKNIGLALNGLTSDLQTARDCSALAGTFHSPDELEAIESLYRSSLTVALAPQQGDNPRIAAVRGLAAMVDIYAALADELAKAGKSREADLFRKKSKDLLSNVAELYQPLIDQLAQIAPPGGSMLNNLAWTTIANGNSSPRLAALAVALARRAVELGPDEGSFRNTLGVALYRTADYKSAIEALDQSRELLSGKVFAWDAFFLAMAHWQLGHKDEARQWYDQSIAWMVKNQPLNAELLRFRAEADALITARDQSAARTTPSRPASRP